jgi:hypothetical protein
MKAVLKKILPVITGIALSTVMFFGILAALIGPVSAQTSGLCMTQSFCEEEAKGIFERDSKCQQTDTQVQGFCYTKSKPVTLSIKIGDRQQVIDLGEYLAAVYTYAASVAGIFAVIMMMIGGFQWMSARDNPSSVAAAKDRIQNALIGLGLTLFAFLMLQTVNPDLVLLRLPKIPIIKGIQFAGCKNFSLSIPCGQKFNLEVKKNETENSQRFSPVIPGENDPNRNSGMCTGEKCIQPDSQIQSLVCDTKVGKCVAVNANCANSNGDSGCSTGAIGNFCNPSSSVDECKEGRCVRFFEGSKIGVCVSGAETQACSNDSQCAKGLYCLKPESGAPSLPTPAESGFEGICIKPRSGGPCLTQEHCANTQFVSSCKPIDRGNVFGTNFYGFKGCVNNSTGASEMGIGETGVDEGGVCTDDTQCYAKGINEGNFCFKFAEKNPEGDRLPTLGICIHAKVKDGGPCQTDAQCQSNVCISHFGFYIYGRCGSGALGTSCKDDSQCKPTPLSPHVVCSDNTKICIPTE